MDDLGYIPKSPVGYSLISLFCGIVGVVIAYQFTNIAIAAVALGAVGMFIGGYSFGLANRFPTRDRVQFMLMAAVGIMASVIAFMVGLVNAF